MRLSPREGVALIALIILLAGITTALTRESSPPPLDASFDYFGAVPRKLPDDARKRIVDQVHDGDSINLSEPGDTWWEKYRLIGIQAPEIEGYKKEECYGKDATAFLTSLLPKGTTVWVQRDVSDTDVHDRFLRHVFIRDKETDDYYLLSEVLVLGGYAKARSYPPDDFYDDVLAAAEAIAKENDAGLWDACAAQEGNAP